MSGIFLELLFAPVVRCILGDLIYRREVRCFEHLSADTFMSGSTPVPSQLVLLIGLIARPRGTHTAKCSLIRLGPPG
jgi:hypothetical protein